MSGGAADRCAERPLVDRHFSGRVTPTEESRLRAHLPGCAPCSARYERHLLYARLTHARLGMAERLGIGLGVRHPDAAGRAPDQASVVASVVAPGLGRRTWLGLGATAAAAAAVLLLAPFVGRDRVRPPDTEFGSRGEPAFAGEAGARLEIYRAPPGADPRPAAGWISARDELAFAYRNPAGFARLLVFGVDDGGEIYWFHPAWTDPGHDPVAVPIARGTGPFELPEAIRQPIRGRTLRVIALFTNDAPSVRSVEASWRAGRADLAGTIRIETTLEVRP